MRYKKIGNAYGQPVTDRGESFGEFESGMFSGSPRQTLYKERSAPKSAMSRRKPKQIPVLDPYTQLADKFYGKTGGFNIHQKSLQQL